jgi:hypothetical protein
MAECGMLEFSIFSMKNIYTDYNFEYGVYLIECSSISLANAGHYQQSINQFIYLLEVEE